MGVYTGIRRQHVSMASQLALNQLSTTNPIQPSRSSSYADVDTYAERQQRQADGLRAFTADDKRHFLSDATLARPYSNRSQIANAMRSHSGGMVESFDDPRMMMIQSNRYDELPEWMGRVRSFPSDPTARQRLAELQHNDEARRMYVEDSSTNRNLAGKRMRNPTVDGGRELEPFISQYPYKRVMRLDRTAMRDEPTIPHSSMVTTAPVHTTDANAGRVNTSERMRCTGNRCVPSATSTLFRRYTTDHISWCRSNLPTTTEWTKHR